MENNNKIEHIILTSQSNLREFQEFIATVQKNAAYQRYFAEVFGELDGFAKQLQQLDAKLKNLIAVHASNIQQQIKELCILIQQIIDSLISEIVFKLADWLNHSSPHNPIFQENMLEIIANLQLAKNDKQVGLIYSKELLETFDQLLQMSQNEIHQVKCRVDSDKLTENISDRTQYCRILNQYYLLLEEFYLLLQPRYEKLVAIKAADEQDKTDYFGKASSDVVTAIFSYLPSGAVNRIGRVNKQWNRIAASSQLWSEYLTEQEKTDVDPQTYRDFFIKKTVLRYIEQIDKLSSIETEMAIRYIAQHNQQQVIIKGIGDFDPKDAKIERKPNLQLNQRWITVKNAAGVALTVESLKRYAQAGILKFKTDFHSSDTSDAALKLFILAIAKLDQTRLILQLNQFKPESIRNLITYLQNLPFKDISLAKIYGYALNKATQNYRTSKDINTLLCIQFEILLQFDLLLTQAEESNPLIIPFIIDFQTNKDNFLQLLAKLQSDDLAEFIAAQNYESLTSLAASLKEANFHFEGQDVEVQEAIKQQLAKRPQNSKNLSLH